MADERPSSFLTRLARDARGNTLAIMAAAMVPLMGFAGSAVDMARLYVVKARLQQACDAGALAGRRAMTDTSPTTPLDAVATAQANTFFANNFNSGWYQTSNVVFTPSKSIDGSNSTAANAVSATASTTVPMAVMGFFGMGPQDLVVTCQARFDLADTDVMFVLDTTGSMSCYPTDPTSCATTPASYTRGDNTTGWHDPEKSQTTYQGKPMFSKIESLRQAVVLFDQTMRASADPTTHVRYGFVTYSSAVNVGGILPSQYKQSNWTYQSRHLSPATGSGGVLAGDYAYGNQSNYSKTGVTQAACVSGRSPSTGFSTSGLTWSTSYYQAMNYTNVVWTSNNGGTCTGKQQALRPYWRYEPVAFDTTQFLTGNATINPTRLDGSTSKWRGCVEELNTSPSASFSLTSLPDDLNPDIIPTASNNLWRPIWTDVEWWRNPGTTSQDVKDENINESRVGGNGWQYTDTNYAPGGLLEQGGGMACGMPAQTLAVMSAQSVHDYLYSTDFTPSGGTYHDIGMIWGTRMLSTKGIFAQYTAAWPGRNDPSRTIVFVTDGTMAPSQTSYGQYGVEMYDNRVGSGGDTTEQYNRHVARLRIECDAAHKRGITIYTVAVGLHGTATPDLDYCSSTGTTYNADDTDTLKSVFQSIAQRIAMLRITQ